MSQQPDPRTDDSEVDPDTAPDVEPTDVDPDAVDHGPLERAEGAISEAKDAAGAAVGRGSRVGVPDDKAKEVTDPDADPDENTLAATPGSIDAGEVDQPDLSDDADDIEAAENDEADGSEQTED